MMMMMIFEPFQHSSLSVVLRLLDSINLNGNKPEIRNEGISQNKENLMFQYFFIIR